MDDHQLILRLDTTSNLSAGGLSYEFGDNSARTASFEYAASLDGGTGGHFYEVRIDRRSVGLANVGVPFGIEIQVDVDDGGQSDGSRDFRIGWFEQNGQDTSWRDPSAMGVGELR